MKSEPAAANPLRRIIRIAREIGVHEVAEEAEALEERLGEGRFFVACLGQFKRGKSTLLNALVGQNVLPTGVTPVTTVVTVVRWGPETGARARLAGQGWRSIAIDTIGDYVSEEGNPENDKRVTGVEVFVPSPLLRGGMCLVDTPGVGSVFEGNTEATREFVPQIDASLVVLGADPPISGAEMSVVEEAVKLAPRLLVVLSKADRLTEEERTQGREFAAQVLSKRLARDIGPVFEVSAIERQKSGPTRDWLALESTLGELARARASVVQEAEARGVERQRARLLRECDERIGALERPREVSERRIAELRRSVVEAERMLDDMGYHFTAVQDRLTRSFQAAHDAFLSKARKEAQGELAGAIGDRKPREAMDLAQSIARARIERWRADVAPVAEGAYREAIARFVELANEFLARVALTTDAAFGALPRTIEPDVGFRSRPDFYFTDMLTLADPRATTRLAAVVGARGGIARDAADYLERLLETNASRVTYDFVAQVLESRRRLQIELRDLVRRALSSAETALERAELERARGGSAVRAAVEGLRARRGELAGAEPTRPAAG